jgi:quercetin dioxygenase-like cupin family protein
MSTSDLKPRAVSNDDGEARWTFGGLLLIKLSAEQTGGRLALIEQRMPSGIATPVHIHRDDDDTFYVLDGEMTFWAEGERMRARAGSLVHIPGGCVHAFRTDTNVRFLNLTTPQHEMFMRAAGEPARALELPTGGMDLRRILPAAERHGVEILGPPPTDD